MQAGQGSQEAGQLGHICPHQRKSLHTAQMAQLGQMCRGEDDRALSAAASCLSNEQAGLGSQEARQLGHICPHQRKSLHSTKSLVCRPAGLPGKLHRN